MTTQWFSHYTVDTRRSFLFRDGTVVQEPLLEESKSGLKLRLKGGRESVYRRDKEKLIQTTLEQLAQRNGTRYWMPVDLGRTDLIDKLEFDPETKLAVFDPTSEASERSVAWWSFKHPTMPIEAVLTFRLDRIGRSGDVYRLVGRVAYTDTSIREDLSRSTLVDVDPELPRAAVAFSRGDYDERTRFTDWIEEGGPEWLGLLGMERNLSERRAVEKLLRKVETVEELDWIQLPDLSGEDPAFLELRLTDTNVNGRFIADMREFLDGTSAVEKAAEIYRELVTCLRGVGMVLDTSLSANDFMQALLKGDKDALTIKLGNALTEEHETDYTHSVSVHLPTGTFVVSCGNDPDDLDETAHAWNEAEVRASFTGRKDVLLAYAEQYAATKHDRRTKTTVARRRRAAGN